MLNEHILDHLPVGVYACDADGAIRYYNRTAADLWGVSPEIGNPATRYCGSYRMHDLTGAHVPHEHCPMAVALATGEGCHGTEIMIERPGGERVTAMVDINVLTDDDGRIRGAVNVFRDSTPQHRDRVELEVYKRQLEDVLGNLPAAIYTTDENARITFFNEAAAKLWGVRPEIGKNEFCGSWKLYWPDGTPLPHHECPMAIALRDRKPIEGMEAVAERPDGTRVPFLAYPTPLFDDGGNMTGAVNMLVDLSARNAADTAAQRLAAIVESSDDAILAKDLDGIITDWNSGAERLYGYTRAETVGKSVTMLIPADRQDEEPEILARIRRRARVEHYETVRQRKDGSLVDISLSVSPIIDSNGRVIGASKIARDITERRRAEEQRTMLLREMNHRIKNLFSLSSSLVNLCARSAGSAEELASSVRARFGALSSAHELTLQSTAGPNSDQPQATTLHSLIRTILAPYAEGEGLDVRLVIEGRDIAVAGRAVTSFALILHEFATNAAKYGALSRPVGRITVRCAQRGSRFTLTWRECGGLPDGFTPQREGFGSLLARSTITGSLGGKFVRTFTPEGLEISISVPLERFADS